MQDIQNITTSEEELDWLGEHIEDFGCVVHTNDTDRIEQLKRSGALRGACV